MREVDGCRKVKTDDDGYKQCSAVDKNKDGNHLHQLDRVQLSFEPGRWQLAYVNWQTGRVFHKQIAVGKKV